MVGADVATVAALVYESAESGVEITSFEDPAATPLPTDRTMTAV